MRRWRRQGLRLQGIQEAGVGDFPEASLLLRLRKQGPRIELHINWVITTCGMFHVIVLSKSDVLISMQGPIIILILTL